MNNDEATIFTSPQQMSSDERSAVRTGEERGKKMAMLERPEHYGNIGSRDTVKYEKQASLMHGVCKTCDEYTGIHSPIGFHCKLDVVDKCIK